ncbi:hypothetical protein GCM10025734_28660 [Kitasatospora paranensis]|uniref:hypothetical protein n=1 Tax=Kitasatospora paranensis TaxID=258053 RepID=UPI0031E85E68
MTRPRGSAFRAYCHLLDRTVEQIAEAARDARSYDRERIGDLADFWNNASFALATAATARTRLTREFHARAGLRWGLHLRPGRRAWAVEEAAAAGFDLDGLLPPEEDRGGHWRDFAGRVQPVPVPATPAAVADYDLSVCTVEQLRLERVGTRLGGVLRLTARRRFDPGEPAAEEARLVLSFDEVTAAAVDSRAAVFGAGIKVGLGADRDLVEVGLGAAGAITGRGAELWIDDGRWHRSPAGRAADAALGQVPHERDGAPRHPSALQGPVGRQIGGLLYQTMLVLRRGRSAHCVDRAEVVGLAPMLAGAGSDLSAAAGRGRAALAALPGQWVRRGDPAAVRRMLADAYAIGDTAPLRALLPPGDALPPVPVPGGGVRLRLVSWSTAGMRDFPPRPARAVVHLACPPADGSGAPWGLAVDDAEESAISSCGPGRSPPT